MTDSDKKEIQMLLKNHIEQYPNQSKAIAELRNVSEATIIQIRKGNWESISDEMWRNVGKQVGWNNRAKWKFVETRASNMLMEFFDDARMYGNVYAITNAAGSGKSYIAEYYSNLHDNVYVVSCSEYLNRKTFLQQILEQMGKPNSGLNVHDMMEMIIDMCLKKELPLLILDEFDKVSDSILYFFITLYNRLEGNMGIVLMATDHLSKRILNGRKFNKKGYQEIYSRVGRRFLQLPEVNEKEIMAICRANGIQKEEDLHHIYNECDKDLRRVKRSVHKLKMKAVKQAA